MTTKTYFKLLPLAESIYKELYGNPTSHHAWAEKFNIKGKIVQVLHRERKADMIMNIINM